MFKYESERKGLTQKLWCDSALNCDKKISLIFNNWTRTNTQSHPSDRHAQNKQNRSGAFSRRIKTATLRGQLAESYAPLQPPLLFAHTSKDIPFKSKPRSCWPGSNVSLRIRQQPVRGAARWSGGVTDQYAAQADKQTLLGFDGPTIESRVRHRCCSQLTESLSVSAI